MEWLALGIGGALFVLSGCVLFIVKLDLRQSHELLDRAEHMIWMGELLAINMGLKDRDTTSDEKAA